MLPRFHRQTPFFMKHKYLVWALVVITLCSLALFIASDYMLSYSLQPKSGYRNDEAKAYRELFAHYPETQPWIDSLRRAGALRDTDIIADNGEKHHALLIRGRKGTHRVAVLVHGYADSAVGMLNFGYLYNKLLGCHLVVPDLHAHGQSDGEAIQMGWKDTEDVLRWIAIADSMYSDSTGRAAIVVHGLSMGAATTMNVSGEETPASVRCFVEDCGYTSVWNEFSAQLDKQFGLPEFPLMYTTSLLCRIKYGWSFGEASSLERVRRCTKPMLFIHGDNDSYVPTHMVYELYKAKPGAKELFIAPGSAHARSYDDHRREYTKRVLQFAMHNL